MATKVTVRTVRRKCSPKTDAKEPANQAETRKIWDGLQTRKSLITAS